jgi:hypothetical protein
MSPKTRLTIVAAAELSLGAYFMLAFVAWFAKATLFSPDGKTSFPFMLFVWGALMLASFAAYGITRRRMNELQAKESLDALVETQAAADVSPAERHDAERSTTV